MTRHPGQERLSAHFLRSEFDGHDGSRSDPDPELIRCLERLRKICHDRPLTIVSGYRSPAHNAKVGGASRSQHLFNRAADLEKGYATVGQALHAGFRGVGHDGRWVVHVDVRPGKVTVFTDG